MIQIALQRFVVGCPVGRFRLVSAEDLLRLQIHPVGFCFSLCFDSRFAIGCHPIPTFQTDLAATGYRRHWIRRLFFAALVVDPIRIPDLAGLCRFDLVVADLDSVVRSPLPYVAAASTT